MMGPGVGPERTKYFDEVTKRIVDSEVFRCSIERRYELLKEWGMSKEMIDSVNLQDAAKHAAFQVVWVTFDFHYDEAEKLRQVVESLSIP